PPAPSPAPPHAAAPAAARGPAVQAAPAVRAHARALEVDLATVVPTGPGGTVTMRDVETAGAAATSPAASQDLRGMRRAMALNMMRSVKQVAPATVLDDADIGDWQPDEDVTVRLIRAIVAGCAAAPDLNAWY